MRLLGKISFSRQKLSPKSNDYRSGATEKAWKSYKINGKKYCRECRDEHELSEISFTTWIEPLTIHTVEDNLITILVHPKKWVSIT